MLTDDDISQFVESLKPAVMLAIFNKFGSFDAANSLQHLAMMKPDLVLPTLLDKYVVTCYTKLCINQRWFRAHRPYNKGLVIN